MPDLDYSEMDPGSGGEKVAGDRITQGAASIFLPFVQLVVGAMDGPRSLVDSSNPLPVGVQGTVATTQSGVWTVGVSGSVAVTGPFLTDAELRATPLPVSGTVSVSGEVEIKNASGDPIPVAGEVTVSGIVAVSGPLTDAELRATAVPVSGTFWQATQPVSGPLTDVQLRASAVPISAAALPLPAGAATAARQPALGVAGTASADVITVQGIAGGTALPVSGPLTDSQLRATAVPVSGTFWQATQPVSGPLTDAQMRATPVPVSGTVAVTGALTDAELRAAPVDVLGPLTDTELRASPVPVSGPLTDTQLRATAVPVSGTFWQATQPVSGPLTDAQLRATAVPVSGTVAISGSVAVTGPLTDTQLRATAVPVSGTFWQATQPVSGPLTDTQLRATAVPVSGTFWQATQPVSNAGTFPVQDSQALTDNGAFTDGSSKVFPSGFVYDEVAGTALTENDVAAARINVNRAQVGIIEDGSTRGRYATVTASNALKVDNSGVTQPVSAASLPLPSNAAQETGGNLATLAGAVSSSRLAVNLIAGQAGITAAAGSVAANTPRVTLGSDDPAVAGIGGTADAIVAAGAAGSVSAKLRRATQGIEDLKTGIVLATGANVIGALTAHQTVDNTKWGGVAVTAAAALADGAANPTAAAVGAHALIWNGSTWDRMPGNMTTGVLVNTELPAANPLGDGAATGSAPLVGAVGFTYNGSTLDFKRGCVTGTALSSAARTGPVSSSAITNHNCRGVMIWLDITVNASSVNVRMWVDALDPGGSGNWITLTPTWGTAAIATGTYGFQFSPSATLVGSAAAAAWLAYVAQGQLPRSWRVTTGHAGSGSSVTYSVTYCLLP